MRVGSGIDWFDLEIEVSYGDQSVNFRDLRSAILNKQNVVVLGDGTFGQIPEEWLEDYTILFSLSEQQDGGLRISKRHFTLLEPFQHQMEGTEVLEELEVKRAKLRQLEHIPTAEISSSITAKPRPYQLAGFQWMQTLDEMGWGGCLADDMGLGKTLQTICFLQYLKEKYPGTTSLVVCPTSLIFNWESEIKKFAPGLKYHTYYGTNRTFDEGAFPDCDIVLTSYGTVRSDIGQLGRISWQYVVLDESQTIRNPEAQVTRAMRMLKSKNRLILSGTPIQNNTYDLYAQFHFLNPGLLGSREFFRKTFAGPIDRNNDQAKKAALQKLIYPFLLRRTKEQVAPDLPDKTETILWCEMPEAQQALYDEYKAYYREHLLKKIKEDGVGKSGIYILEGLTRLRQICNHPLLVKDAERRLKESCKLEELLRELNENTGNHKILVFSAFTEMLGLIARELEEREMNFCYLDGKTKAGSRQLEVERFQKDESVKVFLISLKAGGVGLNLTAADYVYIVDPWWNPAAEQQAIDRSHRIGQKNKIMAYRMICRGTVEERILQLQEKKRQLAEDLVIEDEGFVKKLDEEAVRFLFS